MSEAAIVLCGGRSRRMGRDKATLPFGGETLLQRTIRIVSSAVGEVVLVAREGQALPGGLEAVRDPAEGLGPLAGIAAGLRAIRAERAFVTACDAPFLKPALIRLLLDVSRGHDCAVARIDGYMMTTAAVYAKSIAPVAARLVAERRLRPLFLVEAVDSRIVGPDEIRAVDPALESFRNCNTPEEYERALEDAGLSLPCIRIELFGIARLRAGRSVVEARAATLRQALLSLEEAYPALNPEVVAGGALVPSHLVSLNGERFVTDPETPLREGDALLLLGAQAGG